MISQTAEYALRAVVSLAVAEGLPRTRQQISDTALIPLDYLTRVMQQLSDRGIVMIKRGPGGGYLLVSPWDELTVLDVVEAVAEIPRVDECPLGIDDHEILCPLHEKLDEAAALVRDAFQQTLILDLIPVGKNRRTRQHRCDFPQDPDSA